MTSHKDDCWHLTLDAKRLITRFYCCGNTTEHNTATIICKVCGSRSSYVENKRLLECIALLIGALIVNDHFRGLLPPDLVSSTSQPS
jgi:uncharacterized paraquat-inducible protein A